MEKEASVNLTNYFETNNKRPSSEKIISDKDIFGFVKILKFLYQVTTRTELRIKTHRENGKLYISIGVYHLLDIKQRDEPGFVIDEGGETQIIRYATLSIDDEARSISVNDFCMLEDMLIIDELDMSKVLFRRDYNNKEIIYLKEIDDKTLLGFTNVLRYYASFSSLGMLDLSVLLGFLLTVRIYNYSFVEGKVNTGAGFMYRKGVEFDYDTPCKEFLIETDDRSLLRKDEN